MELRRGAASPGLLSCGLLSPLSYSTLDHQPRGGTTHKGLGPPPSIFSHEKASPAHFQPVWGGHFSSDIQCSERILACVELI